MGTKFKPLLMPNDTVQLEDIKYPQIASLKLDGMRVIFKDGEMYTRSLKFVVNKQLQERFAHLKKMSKDKNIILDGELYSHEMTFQQIMHYARTDDFESARSQKKYGTI